ncbi:MAG TPA: PspA/IM30 family protein [Acidimicrobiales bacterium]|jgi:phage shock protein A
MAANPFRRWWSYLKAKMNSSLDERADPKVQLEQAIGEAQDQHRRLKEQAANVIANQKQTEMQLNRAMTQLESTNAKARQAVLMADDAQKRGDATKAGEYTKAAESFAAQLIQTERQVDSLKQLSLQSTQAADQAKAAVQQNSSALQQKLAERQKLLSQLDQAKMQEQMNRAMSSLSETVGQDVPTLEEVRDKIEARYARALGSAEIQGQTVESRMLEVEQASMDVEAQNRLEQIRAQLGLAAAPSAAGAVGAGAVGTEGAGGAAAPDASPVDGQSAAAGGTSTTAPEGSPAPGG